MTPERRSYQPKPYEVFSFSETEVARWRVSDGRLTEILANPATSVHAIESASNTFGEFLFLTASRSTGRQGRIGMTFYGLGYHRYRERWLTDEWFWRQTPASQIVNRSRIPDEEVAQRIARRRAEISDLAEELPQTDLARIFEALADRNDDEFALAIMQRFELL